jgi:serine/threonine protein kinase
LSFQNADQPVFGDVTRIVSESDTKADIWSAGVMLYDFLINLRPWFDDVASRGYSVAIEDEADGLEDAYAEDEAVEHRKAVLYFLFNV